MHLKFICSKCGQFESVNFDEVIKHELDCSKENIFQCHRCGEQTKWSEGDSNAWVIKNQCHYIDLGRMGYGSKLDEINVNIQLCDSCLCEIIETFKLKEKIYNLGGNSHYEFEDEIYES